MKAWTLLKKLTDHGLTVKIVSDNIRLSPRRLINDRVLAFVLTNKNELLGALRNEHLERKQALGHRIQILRVLLSRFIKPVNPIAIFPTYGEIEEYLDDVLIKHDYDLEDAIATYSNIVDAPVLMCKCGYMPPFCRCGGTPIMGIVTCNACEYFTPDAVGDGAGIGNCSLGIKWTQELHGCMPLYRYADRHCAEFSKLMS